MNVSENLSARSQDSLLALCCFAAFADGEKSDSEREEVRRMAEELGSENLAGLSRQILMRKLSLAEVVAGLEGPNERLLGYEMALAVCEASGDVSADEQAFLVELREALGLSAAQAEVVKQEVDGIALTPLAVGEVSPPPLPVAQLPETGGMILKYSILNGALELLPETMATLAIIPLQMKMVYRIGRAHGVELSRSHILEFLATAGIGIGSQVVEGFARKLMRGVGTKLGGKVNRKAASLSGKAAAQITGSAFSFATTYALGKLAEQYYSGGRSLSTGKLKELYSPLRQQAEELHAKYLPEIETKSRELTPGKIFSMVRGSDPA